MTDTCRVSQEELNHDGGGDRQQPTPEQIDRLGSDFRYDQEYEVELRNMLLDDDAVMDSLIRFMRGKSVTDASALLEQLLESTDNYAEGNL